MSDPYLRCDTCGQRVTAEMDDKRHCELIDAVERSRGQLTRRLAASEARVRRLESVATAAREYYEVLGDEEYSMQALDNRCEALGKALEALAERTEGDILNNPGNSNVASEEQESSSCTRTEGDSGDLYVDNSGVPWQLVCKTPGFNVRVDYL